MAQTGLAVAASVWGVLMGLAPVLQIRRMLREGSSRDVSLAYFTILLIGFLLWIAYGAAARLPALVIPNSAALVVGTAVIIVALRLRQRRQHPGQAARRKGFAWVRPGGAWISFGRLPREPGRGLSSREDQHTPS